MNFEVQTICYHFPSPGSTSQPLPRLVGASSHARWPVGGAVPHAGSRWLSQHGHKQAKRRTGRLPPLLFKSRSASPNPNSLLFLHYHRHLELLPHFRTPIHHLRYSRYPLDSMHNLLLLRFGPSPAASSSCRPLPVELHCSPPFLTWGTATVLSRHLVIGVSFATLGDAPCTLLLPSPHATPPFVAGRCVAPRYSPHSRP